MRRSDSPGNAGEVRRINLMFWVTPHENELIRHRMAQAGTANLSAYLRKMAIDGYVLKLDVPELKEMVTLLRRMSSNINQIARRMNETGRIYEVDMSEVQAQQKQLWRKCGNCCPALPPSNSLAYAVSLQTSPGCGMT